jgi:broad specificity phosphatase PhoE
MGNINEELYSTTPDNAMPLTKLGWEQARKAGQHLKKNVLAPMESVHFIVSPYVRTVETFHGIVSAWCDPNSPEFASIPNREMRLKAWYGRLLEMGLTWHEDPRIREQDFGNYQDPETIRKAKRDRHNFGSFYYRFPQGESASDVYDRVSTFLDSLWRSFDMNRSRNYVLVTHGISIRVLLARYFRYTIHQFNMLANPRNCEMVTLGHDGHGRLRLEGRYQLHLKEEARKLDSNGQHASEESNEEEKGKAKTKVSEEINGGNISAGTEVDEYRFYKRLRILPQAAIRKVHIRISYDDAAK